MYYTLERIEDNQIAVLSDDNGKIYNTALDSLNKTPLAGDVFRRENGEFIFDENETNTRKMRIAKKRNEFFGKIRK